MDPNVDSDEPSTRDFPGFRSTSSTPPRRAHTSHDRWPIELAPSLFFADAAVKVHVRWIARAYGSRPVHGSGGLHHLCRAARAASARRSLDACRVEAGLQA